jgi:hypothetical protein
MTTATEHDEPQAWVGCLRCYNEGRLTGAWLPGIEADDLELLAIEMKQDGAINDGGWHARCGGEEWWVFDHQNYGPALKGECSPTEARERAEWYVAFTDEVADIADDAVAAFLDHCGFDGSEDVVDVITHWQDTYRGSHTSGEEYAQEYFDSCASAEQVAASAQWPLNCIDWSHAWDELSYDHHTHREKDGTLHVWQAE